MQILSINTNYKLQNSKTIQPRFQAAIKEPAKIGILKSKTSYMMQDFLHAYQEIKKILEQKTAAGLEKIALNFPDITIGENLIFHNCGEDKNSITIKVAESERYKGLTYIARRKGNTEYSKRILLNSFMVEGSSKLIKNYKHYENQ